MTRKVRMMLGGGVVLLLFGGFFYSVVGQGVGAFQYYHTLDEFQSAVKGGRADLDIGIRLSGVVVPGSIQKDLQNMRIAFKMTDGKTQLPVVLTRVDVSDLFKDNAMVVVEGHAGANGIFMAEQLFAKCPTKYEAAEGGKNASMM
jgi:cytochrome c-type biogenesis protein CcmE